MMRPIREPRKPTTRMRFLLARLTRDDRFNDLVRQMRHLADEFIVTPSTLEDAAAVIAYRMRRQDYVTRQMVSEE
jgi:hypothetical protein